MRIITNTNIRRHYGICLCIICLFVCLSKPNAQCPGTIDAGEDFYVCKDAAIDYELFGSISGDWISFEWLPNEFVVNPYRLQTDIILLQSTTFELQGTFISDNNLIENPGFENGLTGYSNDPSYGTGYFSNGSIYTQLGPISSGANGTENFLFQNTHCPGAFPSGSLICGQNIIDVIPNTDYEFCFWIVNLNQINTAVVQLRVNGEIIGSGGGATNGQWVQHCFTWNSGSDTEAFLGLYNLTGECYGNDFGIDELVFNERCQQSDFVNVYLEELSLDVQASEILNCEQTSFEWTATASSLLNNSIELSLVNENGEVISFNSDEVIEISEPGTYTVILNSPESGCSLIEEFIVEIDTIPPPFILGEAQEINCIGTVQLDGSQNDAYDFAWTTDNGNFVSGETTLTPTVDQAGTYYLNLSGDNGCSSLVAYEVYLNALAPEIMASVEGNLNCLETSVFISANGSAEGPEYTYVWTNEQGEILEVLYPLLFEVDQAGTYYLNITDINTQCSSEIEVLVTEDLTEPEVFFVQPEILTCENQQVLIDISGSSSGDDFTYVWSNENGVLIDTDFQESILLATPGTYNLEIINNLNGCSSSVEIIVEENITLPEASIPDFGMLNCNQDEIMLQVMNSNIDMELLYNWTSLDGYELLDNTNEQILVSQAGTYEVILTNIETGCTAVYEINLTADFLNPEIELNNPETINCEVSSVLLNFNYNGDRDLNILWTEPSGSTSSLDEFEVSSPGVYTVLVIDESNGCSASASVEVFENIELPMIDAGMDGNLNCDLTEIQLQGSTNLNANFEVNWTTTNGNILSGQNTLNPIVNAAGIYTLSIVNLENACERESMVMVTQDADTPIADAGPSGEITCSNEVFILDASASSSGDNYDFLWGTDNGVFDSGESTLMPMVSASGTYFLTITNTDNQCTSVSSVQVIENAELPEILFSAPLVLNCDVQDFELINLSHDFDANLSYNWSSNEALVNSFDNGSVLVSQAGTYTLEITNQDNGCSQVSTIEILENFSVPEIDAGSDLVIDCQESNLLANAILVGDPDNYDILWSTLDGNITSAIDILNATFDQAGTYQIVAIDKESKCIAQDELVISNELDVPDFEIASPEVLNCDLQIQILTASIPSSSGDYSYHWTSTNGNILSGPNSEMVEIDAPGVYNLLVTDLNNGCTSEQEVIVEQNILVPLSSATVSDVLSCVQSSVLISVDQQTNQNVSYQWTSTNGNIINGANGSIAEVDQAGTYTLVTTFLGNQCSSTIDVTVLQDEDLPLAIIESPRQLDCNTATIILDAGNSSQGNNISFAWESNSGQLLIGENSLFPEVTEAGTYTLNIINETNGCESSASILIEENLVTPGIDLQADGMLDCNTFDVRIENMATPPNGTFEYEWSSLNGQIDTSIDLPGIQVSSTGTYTLIITNLENGCTSEQEIEIFQDLSQPIVQISEPQDLNCIQSQVLINSLGSSVGDEFTYQWTLDGQVIDVSGDGTEIIADQAGVYNLLITNENNQCTSEERVEVFADFELPEINLINPGVLNCYQTDLIITTTGSSVGANFEYTWLDPFAEIISGQSGNSLTVSEAGTYMLQIENIENACVSALSIAIDSDFENPEVEAGPSLTLNCFEPILNLEGEIIFAGDNFLIDWNTLDGQIISGENSLSPEIGSAGVYEMIVTNTTNGCSSIDHVTIFSDLEDPLANFLEPSILNCLVEEVNLDLVVDTELEDFNIEWSSNGAVISAGTSDATLIVNEPGIYEVLIVNNINGCTAEYTVAVLQDIEAPEVDAGDAEILTCNLESFNLNGSGSTGPNFVYTWSTNDGVINDGANTLNPLVNQAGTYTLEILNTENGCKAIDELIVTRITDVPLGMEVSIEEPLCPGETGAIFFDFIDGGGEPYQYSIDGGQNFQSEYEFLNLPAGNYDLLIEDINGCTLMEFITIPELAPMGLSIESELSILVGEERVLEPRLTNVLESEITSIQWTPSEGLSCDDCLNPVASPNTETVYTLNITTKNDCPLWTDVLLKVDREISVYIPSAFSPFNNDGINDVFFINAKDGAVANVESFQIYDRWGNKVFYDENFLPNNPDNGWDGTYRNEKMNTGVFVYYAVIELVDGTVQLFEGDLTLLY